jgi:hypothetical protein
LLRGPCKISSRHGRRRWLMAETQAHRQLKRFAAAFLLRHGCLAVALEVRCSIPRYRADVAGYLDSRFVTDGSQNRPRRKRCEPRAIIIECKQSREDFLRDRADLKRLLDLRDHLQRLRAAMEEKQVKVYEPHLRQSGTALFAQLETWDFTASKLAGYRTILRRLKLVDERLYGETKFCLLARYRLADRMYVAAPRGIIQPRELPAGWGLLECPRRLLEKPPGLFDMVGEPALEVTVKSPDHECRPRHRLRLLRNIAVAATRAAMGR